jgi:hypothetical protein
MDDVVFFSGYFDYFTAKWYSLWLFGTFCGFWYIFSRFGMLNGEKSGNPGQDMKMMN